MVAAVTDHAPLPRLTTAQQEALAVLGDAGTARVSNATARRTPRSPDGIGAVYWKVGNTLVRLGLATHGSAGEFSERLDITDLGRECLKAITTRPGAP